MQLGLMTEPQAGGTYERLLELARWAEANGLDAFARSDHYLDGERSAPTTDALTSLAGLARETSRIQLVVLVTPLTFRHPAIIAKTAATIDEMSGGRFALGIGTGWMEEEHEAFGIPLPDLRERFSRLYETLAYVRAAFDGSGGFRGRHYELAPIDVLPRPTGPLPIVVGGGGMRRTPTIAGRFADEYDMFVTDAATIRRRIETMQEAATAAGRDPATIRVSVMGPAVVAETDAEYQRLLADRAAKRGISVPEYVQLLEERNVPRGTAGQAREILAGLEDLGVDRYYIQRYAPLETIDTERLTAVAGILGATRS